MSKNFNKSIKLIDNKYNFLIVMSNKVGTSYQIYYMSDTTSHGDHKKNKNLIAILSTTQMM